jgi:paraquat-inducible protein B
MKTDPFADLPDSPAKDAAYAVQNRMSDWINREVDSLKQQMTEKAGTAINKMTGEVTRQFDDALASADRKLATIQQNLAALKLTFSDARLTKLADDLEQAIKEHEAAVAEQRAKIQGYGQLAGTIAQKALVAAL